MSDIKIFVARGWLDNEKEVAELVISQLQNRKGIVVKNAEMPKVDGITQEIREGIDWADATALIFAKRFESVVDSKKVYLPSLYVASESGVAFGRYYNHVKKLILVFYEEGISPDDLGIISDTGQDFCKVDVADREASIERINSYIDSMISKLRSKITGSYLFQQYVKDCTIRKDEYSLIRVRCELLCLNDDFAKVKHRIGLGANAKKDVKLLTLEELKQSKVEQRNLGAQFFRFCIIQDMTTIDGLTGKALRVDQLNKNVNIVEITASDTEIIFNIDFEKIGLKQGDIIGYEWAWGCPGLFPTTKSELEVGKRKIDKDHCESIISVGHIINDFVMVLRFEEEFEFEEPPTFSLYDESGNPLKSEKMFDTQASSIYKNYVIKEETLDGVRPGRIEARWIPK